MGLRSDLDSYYVPLGDNTFEPTLHAQGAWLAHEQHMAPVTGLLAHCLQTFNTREDLQLARLTAEILGVMPARPTTVECQTIRSGRTIELDEATVSIEGRVVVRARAWRLGRVDTSEVAADETPAIPGPDELAAIDLSQLWGGGFIASLELRTDTQRVPGRGHAWARPTKHLVEGEPVHPVAAYLGVVDTANGVATRLDPRSWMFPNTDLSVHLVRQPKAGWVGFDTAVIVGDSGVGLTSSRLHDIDGPVGRCEQILTVRPMA
nr:thioesterase family protein [Kineosphaera limosa]